MIDCSIEVVAEAIVECLRGRGIVIHDRIGNKLVIEWRNQQFICTIKLNNGIVCFCDFSSETFDFDDIDGVCDSIINRTIGCVSYYGLRCT